MRSVLELDWHLGIPKKVWWAIEDLNI